MGWKILRPKITKTPAADLRHPQFSGTDKPRPPRMIQADLPLLLGHSGLFLNQPMPMESRNKRNHRDKKTRHCESLRLCIISFF
jgi:hypothetical protein